MTIAEIVATVLLLVATVMVVATRRSLSLIHI